MNRRLMGILLCAFIVAALASFIVFRLVGRQVNYNASRRAVKVVVAARDLGIGVLIKASDLTSGEFVGEAPKGAVLKPDTAIGRGVVSPIYTGEPLNDKRLALTGSGGGLAATIPPGMRACAVKVNDVVGVAGFVVPGMRVDVLISGNPAGTDTAGGSKVRTLLQNIEVLSAGTNFQPDVEGKPVQVQVVNLLVTPEQAELLSLASNNDTRIQLVLRNPTDQQQVSPPGIEMAKLFGAPAAKPTPAAAPVHTRPAVRVPAPAKPEPPPALVIQVINGGKAIEQKFPSTGERQ